MYIWSHSTVAMKALQSGWIYIATHIYSHLTVDAYTPIHMYQAPHSTVDMKSRQVSYICIATRISSYSTMDAYTHICMDQATPLWIWSHLRVDKQIYPLHSRFIISTRCINIHIYSYIYIYIYEATPLRIWSHSRLVIYIYSLSHIYLATPQVSFAE